MTKVAAIQMTSTPDVDKNLSAAKALIQEAAAQDAQLLVLPEMFPVMGSKGGKQAVKEDFGSGKIQDFLAAQATDNGVWIVGGTIPIRCDDPNKVRAACLLYDNQGKNVARYDKIHLFDVAISEQEVYRESDTTQAGQEIVVTDTPFGRLGLTVCYDIRFPVLFTELLNRGAEIITIPAAFTPKTGAAHWEILVRSRAIETSCYVIAAGQEGQHSPERSSYGHTLIVDPWGRIIDEITHKGSGIAFAEVDLKELHRIRKSIPVAFNQRISSAPKR